MDDPGRSAAIGWRVWNALWLVAEAMPLVIFWLGRAPTEPGATDPARSAQNLGGALYLVALVATAAWLSGRARPRAVASWLAPVLSLLAAVVLANAGPGALDPFTGERALGSLAWAAMILIAIGNGVWIALYGLARAARAAWLRRRAGR